MHPQNISDLGLVYDRGLLPYDGFLTDYGRVPNNGLYGFNPRSLFASGEQGVWYDPSDLTPEKVSWRRNLLTYSQDFENAAWTKSNASILSNLALYSQDFDNAAWVNQVAGTGVAPTRTANFATAPDGTMTADRLQFSLGGGTTTADFSYIAQAIIPLNIVHTGSFYVKLNSGTADIYVRTGNGSATYTVTSSWTRVEVACTAANTSSQFAIGLRGGQTPANTNTADILVWGAQLVPGSTAQTYTRSLATAAPIQFADPLGGTLADKLVENTATSTHRILTASTITVSSGATVTNSVFVKAAERTWAILSDGGSSGVSTIYFNLANGTFGTVGVGVTQYSATNLGSGWYRIRYTCVLAGAVSQPFIGVASADNTASYTGDGVSGIYVYGAQVEQASTASAYQRITDFSSDFLAAFPTHALYQESTGVTPVTALGQSVGLVLDKRLGALTNLGPELVTNGTFDSSTTGWTSANSPGLNVSPSGVAITNNGATNGLLYQAIATTVGRSYLITGNILFGGGFARIETSTAIPTSVTGAMINVTASGRYQWYFTASVATTYIVIGNRNDANAFNIYDNISVREVPGNHALQATSAARPTLQARSNLLTYSEQFDNAAWSKTNATVTANTSTAPDGTTTADKLIPAVAATDGRVIEAVTGGAAGVTYTFSAYGKSVDSGFADFRLFVDDSSANSARVSYNILTGVVTSAATTTGTWTAASSTIADVGNGWYRVTITFTTTGAALTRAMVWCRDAGNGTSGILVWGAQLELGSTASTYQRVTTATDYADVGLQRNLTFDGVDDSLATAGNVDFATWTVGTRRNLLTVPTMFDDAGWLKADVSVTANNVTAPDGTQTGDTVTEAATTAIHRIHQAYTSVASQVLTASVYAKANGSRRLYVNTVAIAGAGALFDLTGAGTVVATSGAAGNLAARIAAVGNGWYRCEVTGTGTGTANNVFFQINRSTSTTAADDSYLGDGTSGLQLWGAQLEVGSTATAFQDVGTDKVTLFSGVTKLSDAAAGMIVELSANQNSNAGGFYISAAETVAGNYGTRIGGNRGYNNATFVAPITNVISLAGDLAASGVTTGGVVARFNGIVNTAGVAGTTMPGGNFGSYLLYVGRRGGSTVPFNGRLFQLVIRGAATGSDTIRAAERWVGRLTGVQL